MQKHYFYVILALLLSGNLLLSACAGIPVSQEQTEPTWHAAKAGSVQSFDASGRLAVKNEGKGSYANFSWQNLDGLQIIAVTTPLGNEVGSLCQDQNGVSARNSRGKTFRANNIAELSQQLLGFSLPFDYLHQWVNGFWVAGEPHQLQPDGRLSQSGWLIRRQLRADGKTPKMVELENNRLQIKLVFDEFEPNNIVDSNSSGCTGHSI